MEIKKKFFIFVLAVAACSASSTGEADEKLQEQSPLDKLIHQENEVRQAVNMKFDHYRQYTFAIISTLDFYVKYAEPERVTSQIYVLWIEDGTENAINPSYNEKQFIDLKIYETKTGKLIWSRQFYTTTGFTFDADANVQYRLEFKNHGRINKVIDLGISYVLSSAIHDLTNTTKNMEYAKDLSQELYKEVDAILQHREEQMVMGQSIHERVETNTKKQFLMVLWEVMLVAGLMFAQVKLLSGLCASESVI